MSNRFKKLLTLYTQSGSRTGIRWIPGSAVESTFLSSVQPLPSDVLESLPEGRRKNGGYMLITNPGTVLITGEESGERQPDQVDIKGLRYEVYKASDWVNSSTVKNNEYIALLKVSK